MADSEAVELLLAVLPGLAPAVRDAVALPDTVLLALSVEEGVLAAVPVALAVGLTVPDGEGVGGGVADPDQLTDPVLEGDTPLVRLAVGELLCVELEERVGEGVLEGVLLAVPLGVAVAVCVPLRVALTLPLRLRLGVAEGDAPLVRLPEGVADVVLLLDSVEVGVVAGVPVLVLVGLTVPD